MAASEGLPIDYWLRNNGFRKHPFQNTEAEGDPDLEEYFVEPDCFSDILGNACEPKSAVLFAPRGGGKTANRVIVDRWCRTGNKTGGNVFSIVYTDFDYLLASVVSTDGINYALSLNVHHHTAEIMKAAMVRLLELWLKNPRLCSKTTNAPFNVRSYVSHWLELYNERLEPNRVQQLFAIIQELPTAHIEVEKFPATPTQDFYALEILIRTMGLDAIYVLVDRVDEFIPAASDPNLGALFLAPLISHLPLMEHDGVAFKFFLPTEMSAALVSRHLLRPERLTVREVTWSNEELAEVLHARLQAFSNGKIPTLDAVSVPELRGEIDQALVRTAHGSPRNLVLLGATLFNVHTRLSQNSDFLITREELELTISQFNAQKEKEKSLQPRTVGFETRPTAVRRQV